MCSVCSVHSNNAYNCAYNTVCFFPFCRRHRAEFAASSLPLYRTFINTNPIMWKAPHSAIIVVSSVLSPNIHTHTNTYEPHHNHTKTDGRSVGQRSHTRHRPSNSGVALTKKSEPKKTEKKINQIKPTSHNTHSFSSLFELYDNVRVVCVLWVLNTNYVQCDDVHNSSSTEVINMPTT